MLLDRYVVHTTDGRVRVFLLGAWSHHAGLSYLLAFFCAAQRAFTAAAILARPLGERFRFFFATGVTAVLGGRPGPRLTMVEAAPAMRARACCRLAISASIKARISVMRISVTKNSPTR